VIWEGFHFTTSGYGEAARQYTLALDGLGLPVTVKVAESPDDRGRLPEETQRRLGELGRRLPARGEVHVNHMLPPQFTGRGDACAEVGYTVFEADRIPSHWPRACNRMDEVWVPSKFCLETFAESGVKPEKLHRIPHGVDAARFGPEVVPLEVQGARGFVFLSVFDWVWRKGWDVLLRAYLSEFGADEEVCLLIRATRVRPAELQQFIGRECGGARHPPVLLLPFGMAEELVPRLYAAADAFVLPSRGEGWGLTYAEAMASGLPTIATNWGGHLDFMNPSNAYLVEVASMEPIDEEVRRILRAEGDLRWAEPSVEHLRAVMREVFQQRDAARRKGEAARREVTAKLSWQRAALDIWDRVEALGEVIEAPLESTLLRSAERTPAADTDTDTSDFQAEVVARVHELDRVDEMTSQVLRHLRAATPEGLERWRRDQRAKG
jgi:glycosyltransferase involved in cell wall biosynthesis